MWIVNPEDLAQTVRERRRHLGLSQGSLAQRVGVSRQWVVALEQAKPTAEVGLVLKTLSALGLRIDVRDPDQDATPYAEALRAAASQVLGRTGGAAVRRLPTTYRQWSSPHPASPGASGRVREDEAPRGRGEDAA
jgi:HTH-type transcriptional regulator / antitoxin HipB